MRAEILTRALSLDPGLQKDSKGYRGALANSFELCARVTLLPVPAPGLAYSWCSVIVG